MDIGQRIRRLRKANRLTLEELARATDLSQPFISQIERDIKTPSLDTLTRICEALGVTLAEFFSPGTLLPPDIERLVEAAQRLTPQQRELLSGFLEQLEASTGTPDNRNTGST
jgi:transcriptional regulator with XRE-family HTH domain